MFAEQPGMRPWQESFAKAVRQPLLDPDYVNSMSPTTITDTPVRRRGHWSYSNSPINSSLHRGFLNCGVGKL